MGYDEVLDRLERECARFVEVELARTVMMRGIDLIPGSLPNIAKEALKAAATFQRGRASEAELERVRVACWDHLGSRDCEFSDPEVCAMRAVICALFPVIEDPAESLGLFLDLAQSAGATDSDLSALLALVYEHPA